jgi:hypothetical protein
MAAAAWLAFLDKAATHGECSVQSTSTMHQTLNEHLHTEGHLLLAQRAPVDGLGARQAEDVAAVVRGVLVRVHAHRALPRVQLVRPALPPGFRLAASSRRSESAAAGCEYGTAVQLFPVLQHSSQQRQLVSSRHRGPARQSRPARLSAYAATNVELLSRCQWGTVLLLSCYIAAHTGRWSAAGTPAQQSSAAWTSAANTLCCNGGQ